jgi:hypothetical protein
VPFVSPNLKYATELWIGGTFETSKIVSGGLYQYMSIARLNLTSLDWLPVSGNV